MKVSFKNKGGHRFEARYTLLPEDIGATEADTLSAVADGLAEALAAAPSRIASTISS